jgi:Tfp pilus assembly protein PilF
VRGLFSCIALLLSICTAAQATPHLPTSDNTVLERLPPVFLALRQTRSDTPKTDVAVTLDQALANARRYIEVGQTWSDPRAYGYAQAALGSWWSADPAPPELMVMRARILQFRHEFPAALAQLEAALKGDQFDPDAWLLLASIAQVQGNTRAARTACLKLLPMADPIVGATCVAATAALSGHRADGEALLSNTLQQASAANPSTRCWAWTVLAEIRAQAGDSAGAERAFRQALEFSAADVYARAAYADLLLDANRAPDARRELGDTSQADALLLRAAIAAERNGDADAAALRANLAERFAEARARGDQTHLREQARFALEVEHDPARALDLAQRNFAVQKELADVRILLEAAQAAGQPQAAKAAIDWLEAGGVEAPRLQALAQALAIGAKA